MESGLIHRDIKPSNIILTRRGSLFDFAKLVDFGLVKAVDAGRVAVLTAADSIVGTPHYMAPEAIRLADQADARSDLYAVGAVGYFLLAGRPLFEGRTVAEILFQQVSTKPEPPSAHRGHAVSPELESLIARLPGQGSRGSAGERPGTSRGFGTRLGRNMVDGRGGELVAGSCARQPGRKSSPRADCTKRCGGHKPVLPVNRPSRGPSPSAADSSGQWIRAEANIGLLSEITSLVCPSDRRLNTGPGETPPGQRPGCGH